MSRVLRLAGKGAGHARARPHASGRLWAPGGAVGLAMRECGWARSTVRSLQCGSYVCRTDGGLWSSWQGTPTCTCAGSQLRLSADTYRSARVVQTRGLAGQIGDTSGLWFLLAAWASGKETPAQASVSTDALSLWLSRPEGSCPRWTLVALTRTSWRKHAQLDAYKKYILHSYGNSVAVNETVLIHY